MSYNISPPLQDKSVFDFFSVSYAAFQMDQSKNAGFSLELNKTKTKISFFHLYIYKRQWSNTLNKWLSNLCPDPSNIKNSSMSQSGSVFL